MPAFTLKNMRMACGRTTRSEWPPTGPGWSPAVDEVARRPVTVCPPPAAIAHQSAAFPLAGLARSVNRVNATESNSDIARTGHDAGQPRLASPGAELMFV